MSGCHFLSCRILLLRKEFLDLNLIFLRQGFDGLGRRRRRCSLLVLPRRQANAPWKRGEQRGGSLLLQEGQEEVRAEGGEDEAEGDGHGGGHGLIVLVLNRGKE